MRKTILFKNGQKFEETLHQETIQYKHMERMLDIIREIQIKTTMGYHYTFIRICKFKRTQHLSLPNAGKSSWNSHILLVGMQNCKATLENSWQFLTNLNTVDP